MSTIYKDLVVAWRKDMAERAEFQKQISGMFKTVLDFTKVLPDGQLGEALVRVKGYIDKQWESDRLIMESSVKALGDLYGVIIELEAENERLRPVIQETRASHERE